MERTVEGYHDGTFALSEEAVGQRLVQSTNKVASEWSKQQPAST